MSDINNPGPVPEPGAQNPQPNAGKTRLPGWRRSLLVASALVGGIAIGAGGLAVAATMPGHAGWRHGPPLEFIQRLARRQLDAVGATTAQEDKVHDIIAAAFVKMQPDDSQRDALRKQVLDLLRAPTIDRGAAEKLRADQMAALDAKSKIIVGALLDAADQLTPEQRTQLADRAETMAQHGPWGDHHGGPMGGWRGGWHHHDDRPDGG